MIPSLFSPNPIITEYMTAILCHYN